MKMRTRIGIVGLGYVGGAVRHWFSRHYKKPHDLFLYDKFKGFGSLGEIDANARVVFIAVPTPYYEDGRGYDDTAIRETFQGLTKPKIVVIKSTVLPGSTEGFQRKFPRHRILFNPEFLVAKTAKRDFVHPHRQIIGYTKKSKACAAEILKLLPRASFVKKMPATEAEMVKYFGNTFLAAKVIFANQMYDLCAKMGIRYEAVKDAAAVDPRIGPSHLAIFHNGYRGYGGSCLPKDTKALIGLAKKRRVPFRFLETVDALNQRLLRLRNEQSNR